ncbi:MAG: hypothetical protein CME64_15705 [Halobacteriovoraceae bacterium]|nr:hypothetical protein [Halobacteriovoraceae bacterium]
MLSPELNFKVFQDGTNNWSRVLPAAEPVSSKEESKGEKKEDKGNLQLPSFVEKSKVDLKVSNLKLNYFQGDSRPTEILVNKVLLKDLNLKKTTAFEIISNVDYGIDAEKNVKANTQIIGEIALNKYVKEGILDLNMMVGVENINLSWLDLDIPNLKNVIKIKMSPEQIINGDIRSEAGSLYGLETKFNVSEQFTNISLSNLNFALKLQKVGEILNIDDISFNKSEFKLKGSTAINLERKRLRPGLSFSLTKPIEINLKDQQVKTSLSGKYEGEVLSAKVKNELLSGVATLDLITKLNPMRFPDKLSSLSPIDMKLLVTNIVLEKSFIQDALYSEQEDKKENLEEEESGVASTSPVNKSSSDVEFPPFNLKIEGKHIFVDKQEMLINGKVSGKGQVISTPKMQITYGGGSAHLDTKTTILKTDDINSRFKLELKKMDLRGLNAFLPPFLSEISGKYEGVVDGVFNKKNEISYKVETDVSAFNGELKNLNLSSFVMPLLNKIPFAKGKVSSEKLNLTDRFDRLKIMATATERFIFLKQFSFYGNKNNAIIKADGKVGMAENLPSSIKASLIVKDIEEDVKKVTGQSDLPVLLKGNGFSILPEYKYTTDKIAERAAKAEISKQKKKIRKKLDVEKKKLEENLKNKAKDLLKGFKL